MIFNSYEFYKSLRLHSLGRGVLMTSCIVLIAVDNLLENPTRYIYIYIPNINTNIHTCTYNRIEQCYHHNGIIKSARELGHMMYDYTLQIVGLHCGVTRVLKLPAVSKVLMQIVNISERLSTQSIRVLNRL